ncbi:nuclease-related domain-containing protein [Pseudoalteromonas sp. BDTF-M6]|uniref:nuclease-related domain-containing protein n=1 Tax=Pseudoalteromonas sp. BDTF-M6 TaxID=2796132 RepID=UPI001BB01853|nr:nuclease-related domain-containing protein [Pseudoalteromonas sp. BDTF-M6]MBS3797914.1 NERD domain-containing protein [Pseudoalteromonas sp. BDTF-M6]
MRLAFLLLFTLVLLPASEAEAREYNRAMCILLKQQMAQFDHSRTHPTYRSARRDYDRNCQQFKNAQAQQQTRPQASANEPERATLVKPEPFTEQVKTETSAAEELASTQAQSTPSNTTKPEVVATLASAPQQASAEEQAKTETAAAGSATETQTAQLNSTQPKAEPKAQTKPTKVAPKPQPIAQTATSGLMDMMVPALLGLLVLIVGIAALVVVRKKRQESIAIAKPKLSPEGKPQAMSKPSEFIKTLKKLIGNKKATLDPQLYSKFTNVPIATGEEGKSTNIEHLLLSPFGVFMVAHIDAVGDIYGGEKAQEWTTRHHGEDEKFANPLTALREQAQSLAEMLSLPMQEINCLIVFNNEAVFKSPMPSFVLHEKEFVEHVLSISTRDYGEELNSAHKDQIKQLLTYGAHAALSPELTRTLLKEKADALLGTPSADASAEPSAKPSAEPSTEQTPQADGNDEPQPQNVAPLRRTAAASKAASHSEPQHCAEIHPFVRKKAQADTEKSSPTPVTEPTATPEAETNAQPQEDTPEPTSQPTSKDWSSMSDEEFQAYLNQASGSNTTQTTDSAPAEQEPQSHQGGHQGEPSSDAPQLPVEDEPSMENPTHAEEFEQTPEPQQDNEEAVIEQVLDQPSAAQPTEALTEIVEPHATPTLEDEQGEVEQVEAQPLNAQAITDEPSEMKPEPEVNLELNEPETQSLDDALMELESALAQQAPEETAQDQGEEENNEEEPSNKAKANPFANLSLDPDFTPQEEKIDIGAGPLENEKS